MWEYKSGFEWFWNTSLEFCWWEANLKKFNSEAWLYIFFSEIAKSNDHSKKIRRRIKCIPRLIFLPIHSNPSFFIFKNDIPSIVGTKIFKYSYNPSMIFKRSKKIIWGPPNKTKHCFGLINRLIFVNCTTIIIDKIQCYY